jgi:hypothetical protein
MRYIAHPANQPEVEASRPDFEASYSPVATKVPKPNFVPGSGLNTLVITLKHLSYSISTDYSPTLRSFPRSERHGGASSQRSKRLATCTR